MNIKKKKICFYLVLTVLLIIAELLFYLFGQDSSTNEIFQDITSSLLREELYSNSLSLHYAFLNPEEYGIDATKSCLVPYTSNMYSDSEASLKSYLDRLADIRTDELSNVDTKSYQLLTSYLDNEYEMLSYPYYSEPLSPSSGIHCELPILLSEYSLNNKNDIQNYFNLLKDIPDYLNGYALYEQEKSAAGLFMSDVSAQKVITQCENMLTSEDLWHGTHFLQTTFHERLLSLCDCNVITKTELKSYEKENTDLLLNRIMPAYNQLANSLYLLLGTGINDGGLCKFEQGKEYYEELIEIMTSSSKSPDTLMTLLSQLLSIEYDKFTLSLKNLADGNAVSLLTELPELSVSTPEEILHHLQQKMSSSFSVLGTEIDLSVKEVTPSLQDSSAPAFFLTPPADNLTDNIIYVNDMAGTDELTLYTTLAHEGFPGHLYQTVYHGIYDQVQEEDPIHCLLYYGGYTEGWTLYVETLSYDYGADLLILPDEMKKYAADICTVYQANRNLQLCLLSILDLSIHYYGISFEEAASKLNTLGITDQSSLRSIYEYIVEEPGNYLKYYIGYLEILECREYAKSVWEASYSDLEFHTFLLEYGPADFDSIHNAIASYLPDCRKTLAYDSIYYSSSR